WYQSQNRSFTMPPRRRPEARDAPVEEQPALAAQHFEDSDDENPFAPLEQPLDLPVRRRREFHGGLSPEEFLDRVIAVDEILEFKWVPVNKCVPLVATRLRRRAAAWWQQTKVMRSRLGKPKLASWDKLKKHMKKQFSPYKYVQAMYQQLQNLRQGGKMVSDYTMNFYMLVTRNEMMETEEQLVSRYVGGLCPQIQDTLNMFDPVTVSEAHQRAIQIEKQQSTRTTSPFIVGSSSSHRQSECPKNPRKGPFVDEENDDYEGPHVFDSEGVEDATEEKEFVVGDVGKVCKFVIDSSSCENVVAEEVFKKLGLQTEKHPKPYKLTWLKRGNDVEVSQRARISFSIGPTYKDQVLCDVVEMDVCHLLLGRLWQFDRHSLHDGYTNTYSFLFGGKKI
ncbi:uncharacterized protein LOC111375615, partial [Olea europaea var. sylvestris]|uniref:uncharacterized protein LOC111375615 n=1 Tax=Olea europaea var. sylvestris TaxID=158386 RepID=UPI000C1D4179